MGAASQGRHWLSQFTTLRVGGPATEWLVARSEEECVDAVAVADALKRQVLVLGRGSNVVCADETFPGLVLQLRNTDSRFQQADGVLIAQVDAGVDWDEFVARTVDQGVAALAPLSGIPGCAGATPIQNVGAYGVEVSDYIDGVRAWDRQERCHRRLSAEECLFGYRTSVFRRQPGRYVILQIEFAIPREGDVPIRYSQLAEALGVRVEDRVAADAVRETVLELRRIKGMILSEDDHDTWSVGSFFLNPIVERRRAEVIPDSCPKFPSGDGCKISAAWLIESCDVGRGFRLANSGAYVSSKHSLAICNDGTATASNVINLAREIRDRVAEKYSIELTPEPSLVGVNL